MAESKSKKLGAKKNAAKKSPAKKTRQPKPSPEFVAAAVALEQQLEKEKEALWRRALKKLRGHFFTGMVVAMPLVITFYLANWFIGFVDNQVLPLFAGMLPPAVDVWLQIQGVGLVVAVVSLVLLGWFASYVFGQSLINFGERIVDRVPLVRTIYHAIKQIFQTVVSDHASNFSEVCLVEYPRKDVYALAFITSTIKHEIKGKIGKGKNNTIGIFLPTTPNPTSGFLLFVPRTDVILLKMSVEDGIKMVISAGLLEPPLPR